MDIGNLINPIFSISSDPDETLIFDRLLDKNYQVRFKLSINAEDIEEAMERKRFHVYLSNIEEIIKE